MLDARWTWWGRGRGLFVALLLALSPAGCVLDFVDVPAIEPQASGQVEVRAEGLAARVAAGAESCRVTLWHRAEDREAARLDLSDCGALAAEVPEGDGGESERSWALQAPFDGVARGDYRITFEAFGPSPALRPLLRAVREPLALAPGAGNTPLVELWEAEVLDADGDGFWDFEELETGSEPDDPRSLPPDDVPPTLAGELTAQPEGVDTLRVRWSLSGQDRHTPAAELVYELFLSEREGEATAAALSEAPAAAFSEPGARSALLQGLRPGTRYLVTVAARDLAGLRGQPLPEVAVETEQAQGTLRLDLSGTGPGTTLTPARLAASVTTVDVRILPDAPGATAFDSGPQELPAGGLLALPFGGLHDGRALVVVALMGTANGSPAATALLHAELDVALLRGQPNELSVLAVDFVAPDTDGDGFFDWEELLDGSDPALDTSIPELDAEPPVFAGPAVARATSDMEVLLQWPAGSDRHTPASELTYSVYLLASEPPPVDDESALLDAVQGVTSYLARGLQPGTLYHAAVRVVDASGEQALQRAQPVVTQGASGAFLLDLSALPEGLRSAIRELQGSLSFYRMADRPQQLAVRLEEGQQAPEEVTLPFSKAALGLARATLTLVGAGEVVLAEAVIELSLADGPGNQVQLGADDFTLPDPDGDGFPTWEETSAGSDPADPSSLPQPDVEAPVFAGPLVARATSDMEILLQWPAARDRHTPEAELSYSIFISADAPPAIGEDATPLDTLHGVTSYVAQGLEPGTQYHAAVRAEDASGGGTVLHAAPVVTQGASGAFLLDLSGLAPGLRETVRAVEGTLTFYRMAERPRSQRVAVQPGQDFGEVLVLPFSRAALGLARATLTVLGDGDVPVASSTREVTLAEGSGNQVRLFAEDFDLPDADSDGFASYEEVAAGSDPHDPASLPQPDVEPPVFAGLSSVEVLGDRDLRLVWGPAADRHHADGDGLTFAVYVGAGPDPLSFEGPGMGVPAGQRSLLRSGLEPGRLYRAAVVARDAAGNTAGMEQVLEATTWEGQLELRLELGAIKDACQLWAGWEDAAASHFPCDASALELRLLQAGTPEPLAVQRVPVASGAASLTVDGLALDLLQLEVTLLGGDAQALILLARAERAVVMDRDTSVLLDGGDFVPLDEDGDGFWNHEELRAASDPLDADPEVQGARPLDTTAPSFAGLALAVPGGGGRIQLGWDLGADRHDAARALRYRIYAVPDELAPAPVLHGLTRAGATEATVEGLAAASRFCFLVRALDTRDNEDDNDVVRCAVTERADTPPQFDDELPSQLVVGEGEWLLQRVRVADPDGEAVTLRPTLLPHNAALLPLCGSSQVSCEEPCVEACLSAATEQIGGGCRRSCSEQAVVGVDGCQGQCITELGAALSACLQQQCAAVDPPVNGPSQQGILVFAPDYEQGGRGAGETRVYLAELQADAGPGSARRLIQLTVAHTDRPPVATADWDMAQVLEVPAGRVLTAEVSFSDPDGESIELRCGPLPDWGRYTVDEQGPGTVRAQLVLVPGFGDVGRRVITFHPLRAGRSLPEARVSLKVQVTPAVGPLDFNLLNESFLGGWSRTLDMLHAVRVADLDGDGQDDLVIAFWNMLEIYLGGASRWGAEQPNFSWSPGPGGASQVGLDVGDINADGVPDLVVGSQEFDEGGVSQLTLVLGRLLEHSVDGSTWAPGVEREVSLPLRPDVLRLADVDGDGALDLLVRDEVQGGVVTLRGRVDERGWPLGELGDPEPLAAGGAGNEVGLGETLAIGDIDGDGQQDVAVLNGTESTVYLFRGRPGQAPEAAGTLVVGGRAGAVAVVDLRGTGRSDVLVGAGPLLLHWEAPAQGALDASAFSPPHLTSLGFGVGEQSYVAGIVPVDLFGTGARDLLVAAADGSTVLLPGPRAFPAESGQRLPTLHFPGLPQGVDETGPDDDFWPGSLLAVGDITGDGAVDVVLGGVHARLGRRSHRRALPTLDDAVDRVSLVSRPQGLEGDDVFLFSSLLADLDGDQVPELITQGAVGVAVHLALTAASCPGRGYGFYAEPLIVPLPRRGGSRGSTLAAVDIDGDGRRELVALRDGGLSTLFVERDDAGVLSARRVDTPLPFVADVLLEADVTGQGRTELVLMSRGAAIVSVWQATVERGRADGGFEPLSETRVFGVPVHGAVADFDRDGFGDVLVALEGQHTAVLLRGSPEGELHVGGQQVLPTDARWVAAPLLDEDWRRDAVFVHEIDWENADFEEQLCEQGTCDSTATLGAGAAELGDGTFEPTTRLGLGPSGRPWIADLDHDGLDDVLVANYGESSLGQVSIAADGPALSGLLAEGVHISFGSVTAADVNADGIVDPAGSLSGSTIQYASPTAPANGVWEGALPLELPAAHRQEGHGAQDTRVVSCAPADTAELYFRFQTQAVGALTVELDAFYPGAAVALISSTTGAELACLGGEDREKIWELVVDDLAPGSYHLAVSGIPPEGAAAFRLTVRLVPPMCGLWCTTYCWIGEGVCRWGGDADIEACRQRCLHAGQAWRAPVPWCEEQARAVTERPCRDFFSGMECGDRVCSLGYTCLGAEGCVPLCSPPPTYSCPAGLQCYQLGVRGQPVEETGVCLP